MELPGVEAGLPGIPDVSAAKFFLMTPVFKSNNQWGAV